MEKYIVFKKVVAHELLIVEAETPTTAIENVMKGKGAIARNRLDWVEDCDPNTWNAEPINASEEELQALRHSARRLPDVFTGKKNELPQYCDDCGEVVIPPNFKVYSELPYNVASANKGESALVCLECDEEKKCSDSPSGDDQC